MDSRIVQVNIDYENRRDDEESLEKWALRNCDGFLGTYSNWQQYQPVRNDHVSVRTFYFNNEKSAMMFLLRWL